MEKETIIITAGKNSICLKENKFSYGTKTPAECVSVHIGHPESVTVLKGHPKLYTEEEFNKACAHVRETGQNEAWELARKIMSAPAKGGYMHTDIEDIFGTDFTENYVNGCFEANSYQEAAEKVQKWEEMIRVGDVVKLHWGGKDDQLAVVTYVMPDMYSILLADGNTSTVAKRRCTKIGNSLNMKALLAELNKVKG